MMSGEALAGTQGGDFEDPWAGYQWKTRVAPWIDGTLQQVDVTVSWTSQNKERSLILSTLVAPEGE